MTVEELPGGADVIIVGAGTAGCAVAARLVEGTDATVVVLEAGPDPGPLAAGRWPDELLDARRLPLTHDWAYAAISGDRVLAMSRAQVAGGCSAHNGCTQSVGWRGDYDEWGARCRGWGSDAFEPALAAATSALRVRRFADRELQPFHRAFLDACASMGIPRTDDLDDLDGGAGVSVNPVNIDDGVRVNSAIAYLDAVRDSGRLTVVGNALADRLLLDGSTVVGVQVFHGGRVRHLRAPLVVLAGGVFGSAEVLLRSGVGPARGLVPLGIEPVVDLAGVGANLHDHPTLAVEFAASRELVRQLTAFEADGGWLPDEQALAKIHSGRRADAAPYDLHVFPYVEAHPSAPAGWRVVFPVGLLRPRSRGRMRLRSADPWVRSELDVAYLADPDDARDLLAAFPRVEAIAADPALRPLLSDRITDRPPDGDAPAVAWARANHEHYWHPAGTCRMGPDPDGGDVVDRGCAVYGLSGVIVADASVFPTVPRSTPALPVAAIGERVASGLIDGWPP